MSDYIKRDYVKRKAYDLDNNFVIDLCDVNLIPSEDVALVRHGRWKDEFKEDAEAFVKHRYVCTVCGNWQTHGKTQYCPSCGARMDAKK